MLRIKINKNNLNIIKNKSIKSSSSFSSFSSFSSLNNISSSFPSSLSSLSSSTSSSSSSNVILNSNSLYSLKYKHYSYQYQQIHHFSQLIEKKDNNKENNKDTNKDSNKKIEINKKKIDYTKKATDILLTTMNFSKKGFLSIYEFFRYPSEIPTKLKGIWQVVKDEAHHYWVGTKLLWAEIKTANEILNRVLKGHMMSRRERLQLIRTTMDILRLVPFSIFVIVPFMELLLPLAIKLFPNMLPSTFEDSLKKEEVLKKELAMRLGVASFFIETFKGMAERKQKGNSDDEEATATELIDFMEKAKMGESIPNEAVLRISRLFKDELTLGNISRPQLVTMCQFMGLVPYGTDGFLRFQLRTKLKNLKEDDKRILWEGVDSLSHQELRDACQERGMRAVGLSTFGYRKQMKEWLDLSMQKQIPIALLIMSRAFVLKTIEHNSNAYTAEETLKTSLTAFDDEVINEIIVESAASNEDKNPEIKKRKLESILHQNSLIREEIEESVEAKKREEEKLKVSSQEKTLPLETIPTIGLTQKEESNNTRLVSGSVGPGDILKSPEISTSIIPKAEDLNSLLIQQPQQQSLMNPPIEESSLLPSPSPTTQDSSSSKPLTVAQLIALTDLTNDSAVEREKVELAALQEMVGTLEQSIELDLEKEEKEKEEEEAENKLVETSIDGKKIQENSDDSDSDEEVDEPAIRSMRSALKKMMKKLEARVKHTETELGKKLQQLDKDRDGVLDSEELKDAIVKILKKKDLTPLEAQEFVKSLDQDNDGKVTVLEFRKYVEARKIQQEKEAYDTQKPKEFKDSEKS